MIKSTLLLSCSVAARTRITVREKEKETREGKKGQGRRKNVDRRGTGDRFAVALARQTRQLNVFLFFVFSQ